MVLKKIFNKAILTCHSTVKKFIYERLNYIIFHIALSGIKGGSRKSSGSLVRTLQVGTLQVTYAGLSIKTPGFSSKVQVNPSFQKPPLFRLPLNQTQHFDVFKINKN